MTTILSPREIDLSLGLPSAFGKAEVETAAEHLVEFLAEKARSCGSNEWPTFTFRELSDFYINRELKHPNEMLFGLMGPWYDDGGCGAVRESGMYVVHCGATLQTTLSG